MWCGAAYNVDMTHTTYPNTLRPMTNLEKYQHTMDAIAGLTLRDREVFAAVFIGALSALLTSDVDRSNWERALYTAETYPYAKTSLEKAANNLVEKYYGGQR